LADKELSVGLKFEDDYTDGVRDCTEETRALMAETDNLKESTVEANVEFLTQVETLHAVDRSVGQVRRGMNELGLANKEMDTAMRKIEGVSSLVIGSAQLATVALKGWTKATDNQKTAMVGLGLAAVGVGLAIAATNAQTDQERAYASALTGVVLGLAAAEFTLAAAKAAGWTAAAGPASPAMAATIAGSLVAVSAAMGTYWVATHKTTSAQTEPGQERRFTFGAEDDQRYHVTQTGEVRGLYAHEGEEMAIGRPPLTLQPSRPETATSGPAQPQQQVQPQVIDHSVSIATLQLVGWWSPLDPRGADAAGQALGKAIQQQLGGGL
jgi:hypothetical protein